MKDIQPFARLGLSPETLAALQAKGFEEPTTVQELVIPLLLKQERDIIGQAQTGTGKTAAFGLPILEKIMPSASNVQALILTPTRELALQVRSSGAYAYLREVWEYDWARSRAPNEQYLPMVCRRHVAVADHVLIRFC